MTPSSRTPEGWSNRCPICGIDCHISPSSDSYDAPCPHCGHLLWFTPNAGLLGAISAADLVSDSLTIRDGVEIPDNIDIPPQLLEFVPASLAAENLAFPIACFANTLLLAISDLDDSKKIEKLRFLLNRDLHFVFVNEQWIQSQIRKHYRLGL